MTSKPWRINNEQEELIARGLKLLYNTESLTPREARHMTRIWNKLNLGEPPWPTLKKN